MPRQRVRFCPQGHDKDAPGGAIWYRRKTLAGSTTKVRECKKCHKKWEKKWRKKVVTLPIEDLKKAIKCLYTMARNPVIPMFDRNVALTTAASLETHLPKEA